MVMGRLMFFNIFLPIFRSPRSPRGRIASTTSPETYTEPCLAACCRRAAIFTDSPLGTRSSKTISPRWMPMRTGALSDRRRTAAEVVVESLLHSLEPLAGQVNAGASATVVPWPRFALWSANSTPYRRTSPPRAAVGHACAPLQATARSAHGHAGAPELGPQVRERRTA
jgi:hypothetical protein